MIHTIKNELLYLFLNGVVCHVPCWAIRRFFYGLYGMKIGKGSHILLRTKIMAPEKIVIGERVIINEDCFLDGRGGLEIGNDVSISMQTFISTASHVVDSPDYAYSCDKVTIEDNTWLCSRSTILQGSYIEKYAVIAAEAVFKGRALSKGVYGGCPAHKIKDREINTEYHLNWNPPMR